MSNVTVFRERRELLGRRQGAAPRGSVPEAAPILISSLPQEVDLIVYADDDFSFELTLTDADGSATDLSGVTVEAQIRTTKNRAEIAASFATSIDANNIMLALSRDAASALAGPCVWDCQLTLSNGAIQTVARGSLSVVSDVTR
jgi:hypothetical protein